MAKPRFNPVLALCIGVLAVSISAILVRLADAPPVAAASWRKGFAALMLGGFWAMQLLREKLKPRRSQNQVDGKTWWPFAILAGLLLGCHFGTWFTSLMWTSIAASMAIIAAQPVFAAILGAVFLKDPFGRREFVSLLVALAGFAWIVRDEVLAAGGWQGQSLGGIFLALAASLFAASYLCIGRHVRARAPIVPYLSVVYGSAALGLTLFGLGREVPLAPVHYSSYQIGLFFLMAAVPSMLGHNMFNYAIRHLDAYRVNLSILAEPVLTSLLAYWIFKEIPRSGIYLGGALLMTAAGIAFWPAKSPLQEHAKH